MARPEIVSPRDARLVVTLATIPSRISKIGPPIEVDQGADAHARSNLPLYFLICLREQSPYDIPDWLRHDESVEILVSPKDYGPATKLIGVLDKEPDPSTRIVIVDDDWAYNPDMVEVFERRFEEHGRRAALGGREGA